MTPKRSLWICPDCGRQFVSVNLNHSCGRYDLEDHFSGKELVVRELYNLLFKSLKQFGPVRAFPVKTRIVFQAEVQFAAAVTRKPAYLTVEIEEQGFDTGESIVSNSESLGEISQCCSICVIILIVSLRPAALFPSREPAQCTSL